MHGISIRVTDLGTRLRGLYDHATRTVWLNERLNRVQTRCTLEHELVHAERGDVDPQDRWLRVKQETLVHREAARRLISLAELADAAPWITGPTELAECLDVDLETLKARLDSLTQAETAHLNEIADRRGN